MLKFIKNNLDKIRDQFEEGGKLQRLYPLFEATDTILFSTDEKTNSGPHIRDSIDTKRVMILVVLTLIPLYIFGSINIGYQNAVSLNLERGFFGNFLLNITNILGDYFSIFFT